MIDMYLLSVLVFVAIIAILIWKDRKHIEWSYGILFMRRTERFKSNIDDIAKKFPMGWKVISTVGIIICFGAMGYGLWLLVSIAWAVAAGLITMPALQFILPTPSPTGVSGPGYFLIPFWSWLLAIVIILVPHELSHGIITRVEKLKLKSVGLLLLAIFPGAFVEPDDKQLKRASLISRLRVYAAGSFANFIVALLILFLMMFVIWPSVATNGVTILSVNETGPAARSGITPGTVLYSVNGTPITSTYSEYILGQGYFAQEIGIPKPDAVLIFTSENQTYSVKLENVNNTGYMGVLYMPNMRTDSVFFLANVAPMFTMLWLLSFAVGLFNILPISALDGGLMIEAVLQRITKKHGKKLARAIGLIVIVIILYDFLGPMII